MYCSVGSVTCLNRQCRRYSTLHCLLLLLYCFAAVFEILKIHRHVCRVYVPLCLLVTNVACLYCCLHAESAVNVVLPLECPLSQNRLIMTSIFLLVKCLYTAVPPVFWDNDGRIFPLCREQIRTWWEDKELMTTTGEGRGAMKRVDGWKNLTDPQVAELCA